MLADVLVADESLADRLFEAGCDDGTLFSSEGVAAVGFAREAESLEDAVRSAIRDVTSLGVRVARVEYGRPRLPEATPNVRPAGGACPTWLPSP